ncbi:MAG TPA: hypothetical protein P5526_12115, partial [Anaerolineae bacterium]|nr:hypothetical protein [Anaerolineae bacterium]
MNNTATKSGQDIGSVTSRLLETIKGLFRVPEFVMFLVVVILFVIGAIMNPRFGGIENQKILTRDAAILAIA